MNNWLSPSKWRNKKIAGAVIAPEILALRPKMKQMKLAQLDELCRSVGIVLETEQEGDYALRESYICSIEDLKDPALIKKIIEILR